MTKNILLFVLVAGILGFDLYIAGEYFLTRETDALTEATVEAIDDLAYIDGNQLDEGTLGYDPEVAKANANHKPLRLIYDVAGIDRPELLDVGEIEMDDSTPVIGVQVGDESCAFVLSTMDQPNRHIVNTIMNQTAVSLTYCPLVDCVRVVRGADGDQSADQTIPLRLGGLNEEDQMVLMLRGVRYDQESEYLPLADHPYERVTLGHWKQRHPRTKVFCEQSLRWPVRPANGV
jgi:hypothetical protein